MNPHDLHELGDEYVATKAWDTALLKRLLHFAKPHMKLFALSFAVLMALFLLQVSGPFLLRGAIDGPVSDALNAREAAEVAASGTEPLDFDVAADVAATGTEPPDFDVTPYLRRLWGYAGLYLLITLTAGVFRYLEMALLGRTGQAVIHDLRTHLFRHIQRQDLAWFDRRPTGALVTRVTGDIENLNELFTSGLVVLLFDFIKVAAILGVLFWLDVQLALFVLAMTPLLIGTSLFFRGGARRAHRQVRARLAGLNGYLQEVLQGVRVVQVFRREKLVSSRFRTYLDGYFRANLRTILLFALFFPAIEFVTLLIKGSIVWNGGVSITEGALTFGVFFQFWWTLQFYLDPIRELGERYNVLQQAFASSERVFEILDTEPRVAPPAEAVARRPKTPAGGVVFENVSFAYREGEPVLQEISFEIPAGATFAVVGATGGGKSTLVNLLLRYYDPTAGRVLIDGIDLRELDAKSYRDRLGLVLQEDFLFSGTVRENLALARAGATDAAIARALQVSCADRVVERLPGGLAAQVAERGVTFSTGERELLAIARALAANPRLVILDEATSSVDSATEARIEEATRNLLRGRTALVVAHRLSTVRRADRILVMHHGRLREAGTHKELLALGGLYARLNALAFRDVDDA
ncbi:MAG: ABC transporter ATP-binding protein [Planctomycetota bacterium]|nr:ABC transporter ATP-binding protein [Planctomycetota bacterium]